MNALILLASIFFLSFTLCDVIVTVTHPHAITVTYDPVLKTVLPPSPQNNQSQYADEDSDIKQQQIQSDEEDKVQGKVNAKATGSPVSTRSGSSSNLSSKASGASTDANSAFQMNLTFAIGTAIAVVLAATIF